MFRFLLSGVVSVLLFAVFVPALWGQTTSTEVLGLVTDPTGLPITGAEVTLTRVATGETRHATTNNEGNYSFPLIEPGDYRVDVKVSGFKSTTISNINVLLQQRARVNVTLEIGQLSQQVEVTAEARLLSTEDAAVGQNIESQRVVELPVGYRNIGHLAIMVPGVHFGGRMGRATGAVGRTSPDGSTVSLVGAGQPGESQGVTMDGIDIKEPRYNQLTLTPALEAIAEFKVQTSAYSAEYGFSGGAQIQIAMKSGTNQLHASLYDFMRNSALDAEDYFLNFELAPTEPRKAKNALHRHQFGVYTGGPFIIPKLYNGKNRSFWSFNYDGRQEYREFPQTAWFPSQAQRNGDFSAFLNPVQVAGRTRPPVLIFDPLNGEPFRGNIIPASRINPGAKNLLKYLPEPQFVQNDPLDFTNRVNIKNKITQAAWFMRFDHNISEKDRAFVRLAWDHQDWTRPTINPNFEEDYYNNPKSLAMQWIHTVSPTMLNEFRYGFLDTQTDAYHKRAFERNFNEDSLGIGIFRVNSPTGPRPLEGRENRIPPIDGLGSPFGDVYGGGTDTSFKFEISDHVSIHRGNHNFKTGFEFRRGFMKRIAANYPGGYMSFGSNESGYGFTSFLLGYPNYARTPEGRPLTLPVQNSYAGYFLDDWKVSPKLTANLGLRYDRVGVPHDQGGYWRTIDLGRTFTTPEGKQIPTIYPAVLGQLAAVELWNSENKYFMPRVGLAYRPWNNWVFRTGAGWYTNTPQFNNFTILNLMPPYSASQEFFSITDNAGTVPVTAGGTTYNLTTRRFRPAAPVLEFGPDLFGGTARANPEELWYVDPTKKNHNHWTWSFDIQRELPLGTALTIGYVGSKSSNVTGILGYWNASAPGPDTNFQARRPIRYYHDDLRPAVPVREIATMDAILSGMNDFYHGLTVSLDKRFSRGLAYGFNYVFSKTHGENTASQDGPPGQIPRNFRDARGPLPYDRRHSAVGNFVYELPFLRNSKGLARSLLGGWQVNGIIVLRTGFPFHPGQGDDINTGGPVRPDRVGDGRIDNRSRKLWFDPQAFRRVTCNIPARQDLCHYGNAGIGILNGPPERRADLSAFKNFRITESMKLQLRLEAFNALNTPFFGIPNGIGFISPNSITPDGTRMGEIRSLEAPMRTVQLGIKLLW